MRATTTDQPWDFSHVLGLVNSLSYKSASVPEAEGRVPQHSGNIHSHNNGQNDEIEHNNIQEQDFAAQSHDFGNLGDFSKIYRYLGAPLNSPAPAVQPPSAESRDAGNFHFDFKDDYASDGATYVKKVVGTPKTVQWQDQQSAEEMVTDGASDTSVVPDSPTLSKAQRKKRNRKERRDREAAAAATQALKAAIVSESEADVVRSKKTPANKASVHITTTTPRSTASSPLPNGLSKPTQAKNADADDFEKSIQEAVSRVEAAKAAQTMTCVLRSSVRPADAPPAATLNRNNSQPNPTVSNQHAKNTWNQIPTGDIPQWPPATPSQNKKPQLLPSTVQPPAKVAAPPVSATGKPASAQKPASSKVRVIEPMIIRSGEDRHWALLMKLLADFYVDRSYLISPMNLTTHNNNPKGIHIFVDASNIFIGFNEQLKRSRGISPWMHVPQVDLSFDALALLMERRRPVAKRVLVGSTPHLPAFDKAKAVGYETSILDKVYKARELTERQIFFQEQDRLAGRGRRAKAPPTNNVATLNGGAGAGKGSDSETNTPQYAPARMIEQGVDEILHLKMLESIVDSDEPGIMVLATGDAAAAEYSEGFMAMAERALKKGWTVELVSWSKNINAGYTRAAWTKAWGEKFRIVFLDDYAEELLDM